MNRLGGGRVEKLFAALTNLPGSLLVDEVSRPDVVELAGRRIHVEGAAADLREISAAGDSVGLCVAGRVGKALRVDRSAARAKGDAAAVREGKVRAEAE